MKKSKLLYCIIIFTLILLILGIIFFLNTNDSNKNISNELTEYTPQQEFSDDEIRKTIVSLYFKNIETNSNNNLLISVLKLNIAALPTILQKYCNSIGYSSSHILRGCKGNTNYLISKIFHLVLRNESTLKL